ncbi:VirB8/TrbF family protein [Helicobacter sp. MIT 14-3879]|uniref:type IV secretion system protein n=1 Tax=Helicobacter sp. MIT 14-3879 TaxID=2040649 RepID=UPI0015F126D1|nr:VirB8/TrbF family protein [Helicobacter sp. MIT 14-3879]
MYRVLRSLIGSYILNRESINHIDDKKRFDIIKAQSSSKVWNNFEAIIAQEKSIYTNNNLTREVEIINIAKWKDGYSRYSN